MRLGTRTFGVLALLLSPLTLLTTGQEAQRPASSVEIIRVTEGGLEIRIRNGESYPFKVAVSDKGQRLNDLGYLWEAFTDKGWIALTAKLPVGAVFGDVPPQFLEIGTGQTATIPVGFSGRFWGVQSGAKLRIVVKTWHNELNKGATEVRIASSPLIWIEPVAKH